MSENADKMLERLGRIKSEVQRAVREANETLTAADN